MLVRIDRQGSVAVVTLDRPEAMNALSRALRADIAAAFETLAKDDAVRAIVLTGAGKAFCAGVDLKELGSGVNVAEIANPTSDARTDSVRAMDACPKPIIGAINGAAITGGFELALACDILYASTAARFADTHARVGLMPGWGLSQKLSRLVGLYRAKEISLSGNFIDAKTAYEWGLVNRVFEPEALLPAAIKLAQDLASVPPDAAQLYKRLIDEGFGKSYAEAHQLEAETSTAANATVSSDAVEEARISVVRRGREQQ